MTAATPNLLVDATTPARRTDARRWLLWILAAAIGLRLGTLLVPHVYFPDEVFQYLEPAHRLVFGPGVVPWEYRDQVRNWLLPLLLAGPMWLGGALMPTSGAYLLLPKLTLLAASIGTVWAAASLGRNISRLHATLTALVAATWYELIYFSTQALTEAAAIAPFLIGAALIYRRWALPLAGALLAGAAVLRFQYGPAIALFAVCACWSAPRRLLPLTAGGSAVLLAAGLMDVLTGMRPFAWVANNLHHNITLGRSHAWVDGPLFYPQALAVIWGPWLVPLLALAVVGARRYPALLASALGNVAIHSAIAHKEYRYILLSTAIVALLAAIGTGDLLMRARRRWPNLGHLPLVAGVAWLAASLSIAARAEPREWWTRAAPQLRAFEALRTTPADCGIALLGVGWSVSGGYTYLHRAVPLFVYGSGEVGLAARQSSGFTAAVAPKGVSLPGFATERCFAAIDDAPGVCILRRAGHCTAAAASREINRTLVRLDQ